ncbi:MAG: oligosaccharide flippase family protein [Anaerolineae bacterium]|nr:oligosaccharide flippase family protein [Anaerolineae bacterium]
MNIRALQQRLINGDWSFLRGSVVVSGGLMVARALGLAYGLVLAHGLKPEGYGYVQYGIALANIMAIVTIPFGQHVMAKYIATHIDNKPVVARYLNIMFIMQIALFLLTLFVSVPILSVANRLDIGYIVVFIGISAFYTYYGLARGFMSNERLVATFLGSNVIQIVVTIIVYLMIGTTSTLPALLIYGLSYFPMLIGVTLAWPLPIHFKIELPTRAEIIALLKFSAPVWIGQLFYLLFTTLDLLLLEQYASQNDVGVYSLAKQLSMIFILNSMGISTVLMPRIARSPREKQRQMVINAFTGYAGLSLAVFVPFVLLYNIAARLVGSAEYAVGPEVYAVVALGVIMQGAQSISEAILMGRGKTAESTFCRFVGVTAAVILGLVLVPSYGMVGAAVAFLAAATLAQILFMIMILRLRGQPVEA